MTHPLAGQPAPKERLADIAKLQEAYFARNPDLAARTGRSPSELYNELTSDLETPVYQRIDAPATAQQKKALRKLSPRDVSATELAGDPRESMLSAAPGKGAPIGGLKVITAQGAFAALPSGIEDVYKPYGESFRGNAWNAAHELRRMNCGSILVVNADSSRLEFPILAMRGQIDGPDARPHPPVRRCMNERHYQMGARFEDDQSGR